jgi:hypothetical protein
MPACVLSHLLPLNRVILHAMYTCIAQRILSSAINVVNFFRSILQQSFHLLFHEAFSTLDGTLTIVMTCPYNTASVTNLTFSQLHVLHENLEAHTLHKYHT